MVDILQSSTFSKWLADMKDGQPRMRILVRLDRAALGNLGDAQAVGNGISEMRIHYGPGYRLYFMQQGARVVVLLCGGDKSSQPRDIEQAKVIAKDWKE